MEILNNYLKPSMKSEIKAACQESQSNDVILQEPLRKLDNLIGVNSNKTKKVLVEETKGILKMHKNAIKMGLMFEKIINSAEYSQPESLFNA